MDVQCKHEALQHYIYECKDFQTLAAVRPLSAIKKIQSSSHNLSKMIVEFKLGPDVFPGKRNSCSREQNVSSQCKSKPAERPGPGADSEGLWNQNSDLTEGQKLLVVALGYVNHQVLGALRELP